MSAFLAGFAAGFGIAISVGPLSVLLAGLAARGSFRVALAAGLGIATVDGSYALVAVFGGSAVARVIGPVATPLRFVSVAVLIGIAARSTGRAIIAFRAERTAAPARRVPARPVRAYLAFVGLTLLNPLTVLYFAALVLGRRSDAVLSIADGLLFAGAALVASACCQMVFVGGGALVGRVLTSRAGRLVTALVSGAVITALALSLLVSSGGTG